MLPISKTTFLQFQICPKDTWLRLHKPELVEKFVPTEFEKHLFEQGNEVEEQAWQLFPNAVLVTVTDDEAVDEIDRRQNDGDATMILMGGLAQPLAIYPPIYRRLALAEDGRFNQGYDFLMGFKVAIKSGPSNANQLTMRN
jgi:hypothetical protein